MKFDFLPIVMAGAILLRILLRKKLPLRSTVGYAASFFAFFVLFYYVITLFHFGWADVRQSFGTLFRLNHDGIPVDRHLWYNPSAYLLAVTAGSSLFVMIVFFIAVISLVGRGKAFPKQAALRWWLFFILLEFLVLWNLDTPFVRHAHIFLPFIAIVAGRGLAGVLRGDPDRPAWQRYGAVALTLSYTLALTLIGQANAWWDTRGQARDFLNREFGEAAIHYSPYAYMPGMPAAAPQEAADVWVIHETFYSRYWKSFTTPYHFPPACCDEVYHCRSEKECQQYQELLSGKDAAFHLVRTFPTREWLPERRLFKRLFGSYETFVGDVRVYSRE